ncbi:MAG: hypothetical protein LQ349_004664, partial [Xanthoria aureola]
ALRSAGFCVVPKRTQISQIVGSHSRLFRTLAHTTPRAIDEMKRLVNKYGGGYEAFEQGVA